MKFCPKKHENISRMPSEKMIANISSSCGTVSELALQFRNFFKEAHSQLFDIMVKEIWLEQQLLYQGARRNRSGNGYGADWTYSYFIKNMVGISQKPVTSGTVFISIPTYFGDFFPNFSDHNPFEEPDYFKYPYKHITLDHLMFVYQYENRLELLEEADKRQMQIGEFYDWATNIALSDEDEKGNQVYSLKRHSFIPYIKKEKITKKYEGRY